MRPVRVVIVYIAFVFLGAAFIAPWIFWGVQKAALSLPAFESIAREPFHRYVNRCLIILALAGLWPFLRALGLRSWSEAGLVRTRAGWRDFFIGMAWGFGTLALAVFIALVLGASEIDSTRTSAQWMKHFRGAALAAIIVGFIEELLFRGGLYGSIRRSQNYWSAALISSFIYALLHFFERPRNPEQIEWFSGFVVLGHMLAGFANIQSMLPALISLVLVGMILALAFERTRAIYLSYGLHAGFIFWVKFYGFLLEERAGSNRAFWGSDKLIDGWIAFLLLGGLYLVLHRWQPPRAAAA